MEILIPVPLRVHLAHAVAQAVADEAGVDVLHIKGPAVSHQLRPADHRSSDADVLVRPAHLRRLTQALAARGWVEVNRLHSGGLVEHSANWYHGELGQLDVHVRFPGIRLAPAEAFEALWRSRISADIAHTPCSVPDVAGQRLILLVHAARNPVVRDDEARSIWGQASESEQEAVWALARILDAEVALAATVGGIDAYRDRPDYDFWAMASGRIDAPPGPRRFVAKLRAGAPAGGLSWVGVVGYAYFFLRLVASGPEGRALFGYPADDAKEGQPVRNVARWVRNWLRPRPRPRRE